MSLSGRSPGLNSPPTAIGLPSTSCPTTPAVQPATIRRLYRQVPRYLQAVRDGCLPGWVGRPGQRVRRSRTGGTQLGDGGAHRVPDLLGLFRGDLSGLWRGERGGLAVVRAVPAAVRRRAADQAEPGRVEERFRADRVDQPHPADGSRPALEIALQRKGYPIRLDSSTAALRRSCNQAKVSFGFERSWASFRLNSRVNILHHDGLSIKDDLYFLPRPNC